MRVGSCVRGLRACEIRASPETGLEDERPARLPKTIVLQHLDEYVGVYVGYERDSSRLVIRCEDCRIVFYMDGLQESESLAEALSKIPAERRIGVFVMREESQKRVVLRLID